MLKKLRIKFVFTNMLFVTITLLVVLCGVYTMQYHQTEETVTAALSSALDAKGRNISNPLELNQYFGDDSQVPSINLKDSSSDNQNATNSEDLSNPNDTNTQLGRKEPQAKPNSQYVPVAIYQIKKDGSLVALNTDAASLSDDVLDAATSTASSLAEGPGELDELDLYYLKRTTSTRTKIAFADKSYVTIPMTSLAIRLALGGLVGLTFFFIVSIFLSKWAASPVSKAWEQQQRFVADASHELKTPLTVILANNSILMNHPDDTIAQQQQWIDSTQSEAHLMQGLVNDLLFLAQPKNDAGKIAAMSKIDLSDLVKNNVLQFESVAFEQSITLQSTIENNIIIEGNQARLQRLIGTLLDNACKYVHEQGEVRVTLKLSGHNHCQFIVNNTSGHIEEEDMPYIFDRFYRSDKARARETGGYGLGLSIAKEVAEEHGGSLELESNQETGTTLTAVLPLA